MIDMTWTTTPALAAGVLVARPAVAGSACAVVPTPPAAAPAPVYGTRVPAVRLRALTTAVPFGAGTAADERHVPVQNEDTQNKSILGIHSPGRPLS